MEYEIGLEIRLKIGDSSSENQVQQLKPPIDEFRARVRCPEMKAEISNKHLARHVNFFVHT